MSKYKGYGEILRIVRISRDMKKNQEAKNKKISTSYLSELEQGKKSISTKKLAELLKIYGISLEELTELYEYHKELENFDKTKRYQLTLLKALEMYVK